MKLKLTSEHLDKISKLDPYNKSEFEYNPKTWKKLADHHKTLVKDFENKKISRKQIFDLYRDFFNEKEDVDAKRLLLITMIWGFANSGYGAFRTEKYLKNENIEIFKNSLEKLEHNEYRQAFELLMKIKGMGISYVTKILYFASKGLQESRSDDKRDCMLIFDIRVATSLVMLTNPEIAKIVTANPKPKWESYDQYNKMMHHTAKKNSVQVDALEMFLFMQEF